MQLLQLLFLPTWVHMHTLSVHKVHPFGRTTEVFHQNSLLICVIGVSDAPVVIINHWHLHALMLVPVREQCGFCSFEVATVRLRYWRFLFHFLRLRCHSTLLFIQWFILDFPRSWFCACLPVIPLSCNAFLLHYGFLRSTLWSSLKLLTLVHDCFRSCRTKVHILPR